MMRFLSDPKWVARTPLVTVCLLESANVGQLYRMWTQHSALGQNVWSWLMVNVALWLWGNFYRVLTPTAVWAYWANRVGIALNSAVVLTVAYFRWIGN